MDKPINNTIIDLNTDIDDIQQGLIETVIEIAWWSMCFRQEGKLKYELGNDPWEEKRAVWDLARKFYAEDRHYDMHGDYYEAIYKYIKEELTGEEDEDMPIFDFDVVLKNQKTGEEETIRKEYFNCDWLSALDQVTTFVKEELARRYSENQRYDWYLDTIKNYLS